MSAPSVELNLDGLPGPTHNYAGLGLGNLASQAHRQEVSHPRAAALQSLAKMKMLTDLGVPQAVLPPHERPAMHVLRRLGFDGSDAQVLARARQEAPRLLAACASASSMWAANAATVSPSSDSADRRVHFTPANLVMELHRGIETATTAALLRRMFDDRTVFAHHDPLPGSASLRDEGAANHTRLCRDYGEPGVQLFVHGCGAMDGNALPTRRHPPRQSREASETIARVHQLRPETVRFTRQHPEAIDAGVFHNDVAAVGDRDLLFCHERAFVEVEGMIDALRRQFEAVCGGELRVVVTREKDVPLDEAVRTYLFNSQIVRDVAGRTLLVAPVQCQESATVRAYLESLIGERGPFDRVMHVDLTQSMRNGGGPACLRLRVALTQPQLERVHGDVMLTGALYDQLVSWAQRHYREQLTADNLADPQLLVECRTALDELTQMLSLGAVYPFQQTGQG